MGSERNRIVAIVLFAAAAILVGVGNETGRRLLTGLAFALFALGVAAFLRWRNAQRARVLAPEEKTSPKGDER
ncbi:MAG TPA: hypothetical protein VH063_01395 [Gaiellaceae bacterium]|jgi:hypothetical protein|nr:hypothetical protein [Gaiellaceae bacterium]